jgi:hypothetical protein
MSQPRRDQVVRRHGDLQIVEDLSAHRRIWKAQRVGRALGVVILMLGLAGLFGAGPLSRGTVGDGGSSIEYDRIGYRDAPQTYVLRLARGVARSGKARIWWDGAALTRMRLAQIVPEPAATRLASGRSTFEFDVGEGEGLEVSIEYESIVIGVHTALVGIEGGPTFRLKQVFLP